MSGTQFVKYSGTNYDNALPDWCYKHGNIMTPTR